MKQFLADARISERWILVVPDDVREEMDLRKGNYLIFFKDSNKIIIEQSKKEERKSFYENRDK